jgi:hypothetical protein
MRLLNLASHCSIPPMDGADRRAWHLHEGLVSAGIDGRFVGRKVVVDHGRFSTLPGDTAGWRDRKLVTTFLALATGRDYWQCKMLTSALRQEMAGLRAQDFQATIVHFLYGLPLLAPWRGQRMRLIVDTHNFDPAVFAGFATATRNPLRRLLCRRAVSTSLRALAALPTGTTLVHVSATDAAAYQNIRPDLNHVVIENGCKPAPRQVAPDYASAGAKQLLFVGSLSAQMNQDALVHFSKVFWPSLRGMARVRVAGSHPSSAVAALCAEQGWELRPNVSDGELEEFYATAHYALAPFAYGAGSKLKLLEACGRGVPVLATLAGATGLPAPPPLVHVSDNPEDWRRTIHSGIPSPQALQETLGFAEQVSWPQLGVRLSRIVQDAERVLLP